MTRAGNERDKMTEFKTERKKEPNKSNNKKLEEKFRKKSFFFVLIFLF